MKEFNLIKENWTKEDGEEFQVYLQSFARDEKKQMWEKNVVNTNLPCLAVLSKDVKEIVKEISKGNFLSFLDLELNDYFTNSLINGGLIGKIKNFDLIVSYLDKFLQKADNWASVDTISFDVKNKEQEFFELAKKYLKSKKVFVRRCGIRIFFKFLTSEYLKEIFEIIKEMKDEKEYYVNMAISWLVCEAFVKNKAITLKLLKSQELSPFVQNKTISKCRDSYRVSKEDKEELLKYKL